MRFHKFVLTGLTAIATLGLASEAVAGGRNAGSLLLYPEFDNHAGDHTVLTITNVSTTTAVDVEFVYIGALVGTNQELGNCAEFNREETLTPNDTLTVLTNVHNPQLDQGYVYAFARNGTDNPISHNYLIGNVMVITGMTGGALMAGIEYSFNAVPFLAYAADGDTTEIIINGLRDLDGVQEYEQVTAQIQVPHFFGQDGVAPVFFSDLILISLSGGQKFSTTVDFLVYNDNEQQFSAEYTFKCWERVSLSSVSLLFGNSFLLGTNHDTGEGFGAAPMTRESGWFRVWGDIASSTSTDIDDPAVYAVLIEAISSYGGADLPFESPDGNANGKLLARSLDGQF